MTSSFNPTTFLRKLIFSLFFKSNENNFEAEKIFGSAPEPPSQPLPVAGSVFDFSITTIAGGIKINACIPAETFQDLLTLGKIDIETGLCVYGNVTVNLRKSGDGSVTREIDPNLVADLLQKTESVITS